jgi:hypothetical protein
MSTEKIDPPADSTAIEDKLTKDSEDLENTKDENPKTFVNEALWRKVFWKVLAYMAQIVALCMVLTDPTEMWKKFVWGCSFMILPIIYSALDVQSRNSENQERLRSDTAMTLLQSAAAAREKEVREKLDAAEEELKEKEIELFKVKLELDLKSQNIEANKAAVVAADKVAAIK